MDSYKVTKKPWWRKLAGKKSQSNPMEHLVFVLVAYVLGIGYVTQRNIVFHSQSPVIGWVLIVGVTLILVIDAKNIYKWIRRKVEERHIESN